MPLKVLHKHGVIEHHGDLVSLAAGKLTLQQRADVNLLCETRLQEFVKKRGIAIWDYRLLELPPLPAWKKPQLYHSHSSRLLPWPSFGWAQDVWS